MRVLRLGRCPNILATLLCGVLGTGSIQAIVATPAHARSVRPPDVRWLSPTNGSTIAGVLSGPSCEVTAHDSDGVRMVMFFLDDQVLSKATRPPYSCHLDVNAIPQGEHILRARAWDNKGNVSSDTMFVSTPWSGPPRTTVTVQGDSLTAGSWWRMPDYLGPAFQLLSVSAKTGRASDTALQLLHRQPLGRVVVFALGTNDWWEKPSTYREHLLQALNYIGPDRCLVVATVVKDGHPLSRLNATMSSLATLYGPHRMQVAPWAEAVAGGRVRLPDGTHPSGLYGWKVRAQIIDSAVRACVAP